MSPSSSSPGISFSDLRTGLAGRVIEPGDDAYNEVRVRQAYPGPTSDRLAEIKRRYDPTNLFRRNQNIAPADGARA